MCTDQAGNVHLAYQSWDEKGTATIALLSCHNGKWEDGPTLPGAKAGENRWYPALAAGPDGQVAVAYDVYKDGDYDVHVAVINGKDVNDYAVADSPPFEARPSVAYDAQGRLWIAYEEGPEKWGKNFGALETDRGNPLYGVRSVRVACLVDGKLFKPVGRTAHVEAEQSASPAEPEYAPLRLSEARPRRQGPVVADLPRKAWHAVRQAARHRLADPGPPARRRQMDGADGTASLRRPARLAAGAAAASRRRSAGPHQHRRPVRHARTHWTIRFTPASSIYPASRSSRSSSPLEPKAKPDNKDEAEEVVAVKRMREYRLEVAGKKYQLATRRVPPAHGDFLRRRLRRLARRPVALRHRRGRSSTGSADTDHDNGNGKEYTWWLTQKYTDAYHVPATRSRRCSPTSAASSIRMGHRNCLFVRRGIRTLPRLDEPDKDKAPSPTFTPMTPRCSIAT